MSAPAVVDRLRALGPGRARAVLERLEKALGPEAVAALQHDPRFWLRERQVVHPPYATIEVFTGERRTGKSHAARELFVTLLPQAARARILVATDSMVEETVYGGESGLREWTPPEVRCDLVESKGFAGLIVLGDRRIVCCAASGAGAVGPGWGLTWADDPAGWVKAIGAARAGSAWTDMLKSNSARPGITIVSTTGAGVEFIYRLLSAEERRGVRVHDLGAVENNAGNLSSRYMRDVVPGLRAANEWEEGGDPVGAFSSIDWNEHRVDAAPRLVEFVVSIDPAKGGGSQSCERGIVGAGIDARGTVYLIRDRSAVLKSSEWAAVAWDLFEELRAEHPEVPATSARFVYEDNVGTEPEGLLRAEEKLRNLAARGKAVSVTEIRRVTSKKNEGKGRRASPIVALAKGGQVKILRGLGILEAQLSNLKDGVPGQDRADAAVQGARDLTDEPDDGTDHETGVRVAAEMMTSLAQRQSPDPTMAQPAPTGLGFAAAGRHDFGGGWTGSGGTL